MKQSTRQSITALKQLVLLIAVVLGINAVGSTYSYFRTNSEISQTTKEIERIQSELEQAEKEGQSYQSRRLSPYKSSLVQRLAVEEATNKRAFKLLVIYLPTFVTLVALIYFYRCHSKRRVAGPQ
ncbi:MAG: hypothetical protein JNK76_03950 [Planctomycetales bacterium]|nr:hypothetical protein [Planctomycetales bacterium]MBN8624228.1 hypothetical protein [Planctomycetota bacterium]